jgi:uncharacterized protein (TIGR02466 family)
MKRAMTLRTLFVTQIYEANLTGERGFDADALSDAARAVADEDEAGQRWSEEHAYGGYTSYASLDDLTRRDSLFDELRRTLDRHVALFAKSLHLDLKSKLKLDSLWINILSPGAAHSGHIHPGSVISGTVYLEVPPDASALKLEDPRLPMMMAAPKRTADAPEAEQTFVYLTPQVGTVFLWESYLRHEVPANAAAEERVSLSFNYG